MNDYINLIYQLRECAVAQNQELLRDAANAMERLVKDINALTKERDAAVNDMNRIREEHDGCVACRYGYTINLHCDINDYDCENCKIDECVCKRCRNESKWEWRGVREDNDG